jgi:hypothetical protein
LPHITPEDMGSAFKFDISEHETFFVGVENKTEEHKARISERLKTTQSLYNRANDITKTIYRTRVDSLSGNMTLIKLGKNSLIISKEEETRLSNRRSKTG